MFAKVMAIFLLIIFSFAVSIFTMREGWGLEIVSWSWLIFLWIVQFGIQVAMILVSAEDK